MGRVLLVALFGLIPCAQARAAINDATAARHRVLVSTDIGGTDPDDTQSMG